MPASRVAACASALLVAIAVLSVDRGTAAPTNGRWLIGADTVAGFRPNGSTVGQAMRALRSAGVRLSLSHDGGLCLLSSQAAGIQPAYGGSVLAQTGPGECAGRLTDFLDATVVDRRWRTPLGLRAGDSMADLHRDYPTAYDIGLIKPRFRVKEWSAWWWLTELPPGRKSGTILTALTTRGHVAAIATSFVGH